MPPTPNPPAIPNPDLETTPATAASSTPSQSQTAPQPSPGSAAAASDTAGSPSPAASSPASTDRPKGRHHKIESYTAEGLGDAVEHVWTGAGEVLNRAVAEPRPPEQEPDDIWTVDEDEAAAAGKPAGKLLARRLPEMSEGQASDVADLIALAIPVGIWLIRNAVDMLARRLRDRRARGGIVLPGTAEDADR